MQKIENPVAFIHALGRFSGKAGLHRMRALLDALGNPQDELQFVHLAGTNGKGSTAAMTSEIVRQAGYRVGLFTSPYLEVFHERIRVNGVMISDADLMRLTRTVAQAMGTLTLPEGEHIGEFEFVTAVGMLYFVEQSCDVVVLETGLGGEFDATNCIHAPLVTAITSISLDHTAVLGSTMREIAQAKAGIIKSGSTVVCAPHQDGEALAVISQICKQQKVSLVIPQEPQQVIACDLQGSHLCYQGKEYEIGMIGRHQIDNALIALHITEILRTKGFSISEEHQKYGLQNTRFAGRLEKMQSKPLILLDGAHNPDGIRRLCDVLDTMLSGRKLWVVLGMVREKAVTTCVDAIATRASMVFTVAPENERALDSRTLAEIVSKRCNQVQDCGALSHALSSALEIASENDCILICGSLYLVGEAEKVIKNRQNAAK